MARAPTAADAPADDMPPDDAAAPPDDTGAQDEAPEVIATITMSADGTYTLYAGDEPEEGEPAEPGEGTPAEEAGEGSEAAEAAPPAEGEGGQTFDDPAKLMTAVFKLVQTAHEGANGGSASDAFDTGFGGTKTEKPSMSTMR